MKKLISVLLLLLLFACVPLSVCAAENDNFLIDDADLLTHSEETEISARLQELSQTYEAQIVIATVSSVSGDIDRFTERFYDNNDFGYGPDKDGVLLLVCMGSREYRILSNGFASDAIDLNQIDAISNDIVSDLTAANYAAAFETFANSCEYYLDGYINGFPFDFGGTLIVALIVGLVIGLIVVLVLRGQLKSVRRQDFADVYVKQGSMQLTQEGDYFMYQTLRRIPRIKSNSSSRSGSSRSMGGGRF